MVEFTRDSITWIRNTGMANMFGAMGDTMKEIGKMVSNMEKENTS